MSKGTQNMAHFTKEIYQNKKEWRANQNSIQKESSLLTEEQHNAISKIHEMRHEIHCNQRALFLTESSRYSEFYSFLNDKIHELATIIGENIEISFNPYYSDDYTWFDDDFESSDDAWEVCEKMLDKINIEIREYISILNEKYNLNY